ncbi:hypothetical protein K432DRAFT_429892 [Lepidopterella palustris CBS 459.81]|uniref:Sin3-associated polypeptide Sap18 n=1 Tax=Lepidopterella palustris CBS 459.81 TaxID=1314670 RepID=A0A8E2J9W5_9PEZI|nr:hypothetical protein K432DRAFT_429892 [Lepidopterella palustris CBS 459.81]
MANQPPPPKIDRQTTTPFLLKLFYRTGTYHRLDEFSSNPPPHLQIYTWPTCTLRELTHLLLTALPSLLPSPAIGTRLAFRLIYPDTRNSGPGPQGLGRYLSKDLGSVIVTAPPTTSVSAGAQNGSTTHSTNSQDKEGDTGGGGAGAATSTDLKPLLDTLTGDSLKTLQTARFVIGDYISVAIFPPLPDGSVAAAPPPAFHSSSRGPPSSSYNQVYGLVAKMEAADGLISEALGAAISAVAVMEGHAANMVGLEAEEGVDLGRGSRVEVG